MSCLGFIKVVCTPPPPALPDELPGAPEVGTRLITDPGDLQKLTINKTTDARTALTRGLAEYISQLSVEVDGRLSAFYSNVYETYPDPENNSIYPSATVYSNDTGTYDASRLTQQANTKENLPAPDQNTFLVSPSEYVLDMVVELWANDAKERMALVAMLEEALNPVMFMASACRLELPHYCNQRADYEMISSVYIDDEQSAIRRFRIARVTVRGRVPVCRIVTLPGAMPRTRVKVT